MELKRVQVLGGFVLFFLASLSSTLSPDPGSRCYYTLLYPNTIEPFTTYNVTVFLNKNSIYRSNYDSCEFQLRIEILCGSDNYTELTVLSQDVTPGTISISVGNLSEPTALLQVQEFPSTSFHSNMQERTLTVARARAPGDVEVTVKTVLVETDKPFYKPGETVRIRAVLLDSQRKPVLNGEVRSLNVRDPNNFILRSWKNQSSPLGLWKGQLELATELTLGKWGIEVTAGEKSEVTKVSFTVEEYVLPKWDVKFKVPGYLMRRELDDSPWTATVEAMYTYGQPVQGNGTLQVKLIRGGNTPHRWQQQPHSRTQKPMQKKIHFLLESTTTTLSINMSDLEPPQENDQLEVVVTVAEAATGTRRNVTRTITLEEHPYRVKVVKTPKDSILGIPFTMVFQITTLSDVPLVNINTSALEILFYDSSSSPTTPQYQIDEHGLIVVNATRTSPWYYRGYSQTGRPCSGCIRVRYGDLQYDHLLEGGTTSFKAEVMGYSYPKVSVRVLSSSTLFQLNYAVLADKEILHRGEITNSAAATKYVEFEFDLPAHEDSARLTLYVFTISEFSFLESSIYLDFPKNGSGNESDLQISVSAASVKPGGNLTLTIRSQAGSLVALKGLDNSVRLLGDERKPWSQVLIEKEASSSETPFQASGFSYLTNWAHFYYSRNFESTLDYNDNEPVPVAYDLVVEEREFESPYPSMVPFLLAPSSVPPPTIRKFFPETWLWDEFQIPNDRNVIEVNRTAADTLTSWAISGYSLNPGSSISLLEKPVEFKTFTPFFISLPLPYSVVMGEVMTLKVLIHNYLPTGGSTNVTVIFSNVDKEFEFQNHNSGSGPVQLIVTCPPQQVSSVDFKIRPLKFGELNLNIQALSDKGADGVSRTLRVVPPGRKVTKSTSIFLIPSDKQTLQEQLKVSWPKAVVPNTENVKLSIVSYIMGSSFENLDHLIQLPVGCGEQNMLNFVVDIVALDYMRVTNTIKPEIRAKALKFLQSGYQRQLNYRHEDGSFSAFGKGDERGSTWLTAFVMRSFIQASKYIEIDNKVIFQGLNFVRSQQQPDGSFIERGRLLNSAMQGGVNSKKNAGLTAYCLLTMLEASAGRLENLNEPMESALRFLEGETNDEHSYTVALTALAQQLAMKRNLNVNSTASDIVFEKLKTLSQRDPDAVGSLYWESGGTSKHTAGGSKANKINPAAIETTSYALLAYLSRDELTAAVPIVKWLINMRNENGGFMSTQDTVVGLTALSQFAENTFAASPNVQVEIGANGKTRSLTIDATNADTLQEFLMRKYTKEVQVQVTGNGSVVAQLTWSCYVNDTGREAAFNMSVTPLKQGSSAPTLEICASTSKPGRNSKMSIMEVDLPSGHVLNTDSMGSVVALSNYKRHELTHGDTHLSIYFDSMSNNETCAQIGTYQVFQVDESAPSLVSVYDYYDTTRRARAFYTLDASNSQSEEPQPIHPTLDSEVSDNPGAIRGSPRPDP